MEWINIKKSLPPGIRCHIDQWIDNNVPGLKKHNIENLHQLALKILNGEIR